MAHDFGKKRVLLDALLFAAFLLLSGCSTADFRLQIGEKVGGLFTLHTVTVPALATPRPTKTATLTETPRNSATPLPTETATVTPMPVHSPTPFFIDVSAFTQASNDTLKLMSDVTVPDGSIFHPNDLFVKSWRIWNTGNKVWNEKYRLVVAYQNPFSSPQMTQAIWIQPTDLIDFAISTWGPRQYQVKPDSVTDLVIPLQAPSMPGDYQVEYYLVNDQDQLVSPKFWIQFKVELRPEEQMGTATAIAMQTQVATLQQGGEISPTETPLPTDSRYDWTGTWLIRDPFQEQHDIPIHAWFQQDGDLLSGFFYNSMQEPVIVEGRLEKEGRVFNGKFALPWQNRAIPVIWRMNLTGNQFYSVADVQENRVGVICGGRGGFGFPDYCELPYGD